MESNITKPADGLRAEIAALASGGETSGVSPEDFLASTPADKTVKELRRHTGERTNLSTTLALMLRLDDATLGLLLAALRDGQQATAAVATAGGEPDAAAALAESYMDNYRMGTLLDASMRCLSNLLARMERAGTLVEADAGTRESLRVLGVYTLWREEPESPDATALVEELADERRRRSHEDGALLMEGPEGADMAGLAAATVRARVLPAEQSQAGFE